MFCNCAHEIADPFFDFNPVQTVDPSAYSPQHAVSQNSNLYIEIRQT